MKKIWISLFALSSIFTFQLIEINAVEGNNENVGDGSKIVERYDKNDNETLNDNISLCSGNKGKI